MSTNYVKDSGELIKTAQDNENGTKGVAALGVLGVTALAITAVIKLFAS